MVFKSDKQRRAYFAQKDINDVKKIRSWRVKMFYDARMPLIREKLNEENKKLWDNWTYEQKAMFIAKQIQKGYMI